MSERFQNCPKGFRKSLSHQSFQAALTLVLTGPSREHKGCFHLSDRGTFPLADKMDRRENRSMAVEAPPMGQERSIPWDNPHENNSRASQGRAA